MRQARRAAVGLLVLLSPALRADPPTPVSAAPPWKFDTVHLTDGRVLYGLVGEDTPRGLRFSDVRRKPGRPTMVVHTLLKPGEVARIDRLADADRKVLAERLQQLQENGPAAEPERLGALALVPVAWGAGRPPGWRYTSRYFDLTSGAPEEIVRRAALRLEQIYLAYERFLPARQRDVTPTGVLLITDLAEYRKMLAEQKQKILNLAFYDPAGNRIVCASDLDGLGRRLADVKQRHRQMRAELDRQEAEYAKLYRGKELAQVVQKIAEKRRELNATDAKNNHLFDQATQALFATLYHEAFHAYLATFVYPPKGDPGELPRWLNEGLAQIFETALVEANELRVDHADAARLARAKDALRKSELVPLADLLKSGPKQFMLTHIVDKQTSDRHYLTAWGLAYYLTLGRGLLGTAALDRYVRALHQGRDPVAAFEELVGQPLGAFEAEFRKYLQQLLPDGSLAK